MSSDAEAIAPGGLDNLSGVLVVSLAVVKVDGSGEVILVVRKSDRLMIAIV
jgi:hypothetical protein